MNTETKPAPQVVGVEGFDDSQRQQSEAVFIPALHAPVLEYTYTPTDEPWWVTAAWEENGVTVGTTARYPAGGPNLPTLMELACRNGESLDDLMTRWMFTDALGVINRALMSVRHTDKAPVFAFAERPMCEDMTPDRLGALDAPVVWLTPGKEKKPKKLRALPAPPEVEAKSALERQVGGSHYKDMAIQPIEFAMRNGFNACQTLALRYLSRSKGGLKKRLEEREKARHCIEMEMEFIRADEALSVGDRIALRRKLINQLEGEIKELENE